MLAHGPSASRAASSIKTRRVDNKLNNWLILLTDDIRLPFWQNVGREASSRARGSGITATMILLLNQYICARARLKIRTVASRSVPPGRAQLSASRRVTQA